ncbi:serine/threonine protein kinase [Streptomyces sp. WMMC500]|uniref:serine/threonine-protein kinase n=1 Tax=Streptomyces sp. WMMC500 TaxID=3015154 RepID=UPI00248CC135|nr:serine/threonine-protein kinase [Streptomyces sp. WMMC500]WBB64147.1 serine/threonine protein kinase [Streptomyces sp. WMMC500]
MTHDARPQDTTLDPEAGGVVPRPVAWRTGEVLLGTYQIGELLGQGGMGEVHRVRHLGWQVDLAVKSPRPTLWSQGADAFIDEAGVWVGLPPHPHVCTCHYVRVIGGVPRIFAELVEGGTVAQALRAGRLRTVADILDVAIQMAWGLRAAHQAGVVHQDVKPSNALITADGLVKITDFGLASAQQRTGGTGDVAVGESILATRRGLTPAYASPEQTAGQRVGRRSDVWSWAVSVLELFAGQVTWRWGALAAEALSDAAMPRSVVDLLRECLVPDPAGRPADLGPLAERLIAVYHAEVGVPYPRTAADATTWLADGRNNAALSLMDLGRADQAETSWRQALEVDPHHVYSTFNRYLARWRTGQIADGELVQRLERFRSALPGTDPGRHRMDFLIGTVHLERNDIPAAADLVGRAARALPADPEVVAVQDALAGRKTVDHSPVSLAAGSAAGGPAGTFALSGDGRQGVCGGADGTVGWWDLRTGACLRTAAGHVGEVSSVALSADGGSALSGGEDGRIRRWDSGTGACVTTLTGHDGRVSAVACTDDGRGLSGGADGTVRWWDLGTGRCLRTLTGHDGVVNHVAGVTGTRALSAGADGTVRLWDLGTGTCVRVFTGHRDEVNVVEPVPGEERFLSCGEDGSIRLWEIPGGGCLWVRAYPHPIVEMLAPNQVALSVGPDGRHALAADSEGLVTWWDLAVGRCLRSFHGHRGAVRSVRFVADGRAALSAGIDGTVHRRDLTPGEPAAWAYSRPRTAVDLHADADDFERRLDTARSRLAHGDARSAIAELRRARAVPGFENDTTLATLWRQAGHGGRRTTVLGTRLLRRLPSPAHLAQSVAITPDARYAFTAAGDCVLRWWDLKTDECVATFPSHNGFLSLAVTPDARRALTATETLRWWELTRRTCQREITVPTDKPVFAAAMTPDGRRALSAGADGVLRWWDLPAGRCLKAIEGGFSPVAVLANGLRALSSGPGTGLRWWNLNTGRLVHEFTEHTAHVTAVAATPTGRRAVSGDAEGTLHAWDLAAPGHLRTLTGHTAQINAVAISTDGRHALSVSEDGTLRLWDLATGQCLHQRELGYIASAAMTPDAHHAITGMADGDALVWEIDWDYET